MSEKDDGFNSPEEEIRYKIEQNRPASEIFGALYLLFAAERDPLLAYYAEAMNVSPTWMFDQYLRFEAKRDKSLVQVEEAEKLWTPDQKTVQWCVDQLGALVSQRQASAKPPRTHQNQTDGIIAACARHLAKCFKAFRPSELNLPKD